MTGKKIIHERHEIFVPFVDFILIIQGHYFSKIALNQTPPQIVSDAPPMQPEPPASG
jgi:hypothetical protein